MAQRGYECLRAPFCSKVRFRVWEYWNGESMRVLGSHANLDLAVRAWGRCGSGKDIEEWQGRTRERRERLERK